MLPLCLLCGLAACLSAAEESGDETQPLKIARPRGDGNTGYSRGEQRFASGRSTELDRLLSTIRLSRDTGEKLRATRELAARKLSLDAAQILLAEESPNLKVWGIFVLRESVLLKDITLVQVNPDNAGCACSLLLPQLCNRSEKVRFYASLLLYKITGVDFSYRYNDLPDRRDAAAKMWAQHIANSPEFSCKRP